jgi:regulator of protease activity HflC (stomatin/prohibitin superfamily)
VWVTENIFGLSRIKGPGIAVIIKPIAEFYREVSIAQQPLYIEQIETTTSDNWPVVLNAVIYFKIVNPLNAVFNVDGLIEALMRDSETKLFEIGGKNSYKELREKQFEISQSLMAQVSEEIQSEEFGVSIVKANFTDAVLRSKEDAREYSAPARAERRSEALRELKAGMTEYVTDLKDALSTAFENVPEEQILSSIVDTLMADAIEKGGSQALVSVARNFKKVR